MNNLLLRNVLPADLPIFFIHEQDPVAIHAAAFTAKDPTNWDAFSAHWERVLASDTGFIRTIVLGEAVIGHVLSYEEEGRSEVSYWLDRAYWGKGYATQALSEFLAHVHTARPIYARVVKDNSGSLRVLQKCGFTIIGEDRGFANGRGEEVEEFLLRYM